MVDHPENDWAFHLRITVGEDGSATCTGLGMTPRTGKEHEWVSDVLANLAPWGLRGWVRYAVAIAATVEETGQNPLEWPELPVDLAGPRSAVRHWSAVADTWASQGTRRRKATTPARLRDVATTYNAAVAEGRRDPTVAVAEKMHVSRSQAAKLVMQCRRTQPPLLEPAQRKRKERS